MSQKKPYAIYCQVRITNPARQVLMSPWQPWEARAQAEPNNPQWNWVTGLKAYGQTRQSATMDLEHQIQSSARRRGLLKRPSTTKGTQS